MAVSIGTFPRIFYLKSAKTTAIMTLLACVLKTRPSPNRGRIWFRRGLRSLVVHAEIDSTRKNSFKKIVANDENFALAA